MNVVHFIYDHQENPWVGGGGATRVRELYARLADRHQVTVVCGLYPGAEDYESRGVRYRFVGSQRDNYVASTLYFALEAARYRRRYADAADVMVEDFSPFNPIFAYREKGTPVALQIHHREGVRMLKRFGPLGVPFYAIEKLYPHRFSHITSVSDASRARYGLRKERASVIPNGIDATLLTVPTSDDGYVCYVGRIDVRNKGLDTLALAASDAGLPVFVAGRGRGEKKLRRLVNSLGPRSNLTITGFLPEAAKVKLIANSTCLVLPSRNEGQGIAALEAAACGKPVIVSDIPELRYCIKAGFATAFTLGDAAALASTIRNLVADKEARVEMGVRGREYAMGCTWDEVATEYETFLRGVATSGLP